MPDRFCKHLQDYAVVYVQTEAAYELCNELVDRIVASGFDDALNEALLTAVKEWEASTIALRETFSRLVAEHRVRLPRSRKLKARCVVCQRLVPKLEFPEWKIDAKGEIIFRGDVLPRPEPAGAAG